MRCCFVDLSRIGSVNITPEQWFAGIVSELWRGLALPPGSAMVEWWQSAADASLSQKLARFFEDLVPQTYPGERVAVFFDEVDAVLSLPFEADDFFSVIRSVFNGRAESEALRLITFAFFGVATPTDLISDRNRSPFNVGRAIGLEGFTLAEAEPLSTEFSGDTSLNHALLERVIYWSNGQPFLTQKLCQLVVSGGGLPASDSVADWVDELVEQNVVSNWEENDNPEHLRTIRDRLTRDERYSTALMSGYAMILEAPDGRVAVDDIPDFHRLYLTGVVAQSDGYLIPRTRIYQVVFNARWLAAQLDAQRPYADNMRNWQQSGDDEWLLSGAELVQAKQWSEGRHLPEEDHRFVAASQALESRTIQALNDRLQEEVAQRLVAEKELEAARREAEQANSAKTEFLARVSHEVRTPINSVMGLAQLAQQHSPDRVTRDYLQKILRSSGYMLGVVNDFVDIGRVERGDLTLTRETFCIEEVIDRSIDIVGPRLKDQGLDLELQLPDRILPLVEGDPNRLEQMILNLMTNAIKHTPSGCIRIALNVDAEDDEMVAVSIDVVDPGAGVGEQPVSGRVTTGDESVLAPGLGLSLCCEIARLMNGTLSVKSEPEQGSAFTASLSLPRTTAVSEQLEQLDCSVAINDPSIAEKLAPMLSLLGCDKVSKQALPDLVLFDGLDPEPGELPAARAVAVMPLSAPLPDRLLARGIEHRLDIPCSWWRLRQTLEQVRSAGKPVANRSYRFAEPYQVLVAEDDEMSRLIVTELLERAGLVVTTAMDGRQALDCLEQAAFDLVLMDIEMPVMGGLEAVDRIRAMDSAAAKLPVVAMTAHALLGDRERFLAAGMSDYLTKPVEPETLVATMSRWLPGELVEAAAKEDQKKILVVDDDAATLHLVREMLKSEYQVLIAKTGEKGVELLSAAPDLVLLDINMPGMNGVDTCRRIKASAHGVPVILMSATQDEPTLAEALNRAGADEFVQKPISATLLSRRIATCLEG